MQQKNNKKHAVKMLTYLVIIVIIAVGGTATGLFESMGNVLDGIRPDPTAFFRLIVMTLLVLIVENLIILILNLIKPRTARAATVLTLSRSIVRYAAIILAVCWGLTIIGVNLSTVVASVGIMALVIGFGAESMISDVVTGIFLLFEDQYNVGDIVETNGFRGTVRSIGIRTTAIEDAGGNVKIINNANMTNILNRSNHCSRAVCNIGISYNTDLEAFEKTLPEILQAIYEANKDVLKAVPVYLGVEALDSSAVVLKFVAEVAEADIYTGNRILNRALLLAFKKAGVEIPFQQVEVHTK